MQKKQDITVSGRNWGEIFQLPCILEICKQHVEDTKPNPFAILDCAACLFFEVSGCHASHMVDGCDEAYPGDHIIQYDNGRWLVESHTPEQTRRPDPLNYILGNPRIRQPEKD